MRQNILLSGMIIPAMLYMQNISAQTTQMLGDNLSGNYQKEVLLDPAFLSASLDTIVHNIREHQYDHYTYRQLIKALVQNPDMQKEIAIYQLNNATIYRGSSDPFFHQTQIIKTILLSKGLALRAGSEYGFSISPVVGVNTISGKDKYIQALLPTIIQYDNIHTYHIKDSSSQLVATPIGREILVNDYAENLHYRDMTVSHPELNTQYTRKDITDAIYANEKLHIYEGIAYGSYMTNKDTVQCGDTSYTRREINEMRSDYISLEHDPRYIYTLIHNMVYDDIVSQEMKENNIQAKYKLSQDILKKMLQQKGYTLFRRGEKYYIDHTNHAVLSGSNEQGIADYIYKKLSIVDIDEIITYYRQQAFIYKGYLDLAYQDKKNHVPK